MLRLKRVCMNYEQQQHQQRIELLLNTEFLTKSLKTFFPVGRMELPTTNDRIRDTSIIQEFLRSTEATSRDKKEKKKEKKKFQTNKSMRKKKKKRNLQLALISFL